MTVHVTTTPLDGRGTVVTLRGIADESLVATLADAIARLRTFDPTLFVDTRDLAQPRTPTGIALLDQLLGDRDMARTVVRGVTAPNVGLARS